MANSTGNDKRRFSRIAFDADVVLIQNNKEWHSKLLDISLNGVLINTPAQWDAAIGEHFTLEIIFANGGNLISAQVAVAHSEKDHVGFRITNIDIESVSHLRRLVELNLGDSALLERELSALHWK